MVSSLLKSEQEREPRQGCSVSAEVPVGVRVTNRRATWSERDSGNRLKVPAMLRRSILYPRLESPSYVTNADLDPDFPGIGYGYFTVAAKHASLVPDKDLWERSEGEPAHLTTISHSHKSSQSPM